MQKAEWSDPAREDLKEIGLYIAGNSSALRLQPRLCERFAVIAITSRVSHNRERGGQTWVMMSE